MNNNSQLKDLLKKIQGILNSGSLRAILESKDLALIGDSLVNFIFSTLKLAYLVCLEMFMSEITY